MGWDQALDRTRRRLFGFSVTAARFSRAAFVSGWPAPRTRSQSASAPRYSGIDSAIRPFEHSADNHPGLGASDVARHRGHATAGEAHDRHEHRVQGLHELDLPLPLAGLMTRPRIHHHCPGHLSSRATFYDHLPACTVSPQSTWCHHRRDRSTRQLYSPGGLSCQP